MLKRRQPMPKLVDYKAKYREALRVMDQAIATLRTPVGDELERDMRRLLVRSFVGLKKQMME